MARPTVVLPQPDSPTRPSVSPCPSVERHVVDGADFAVLRSRRRRTPGTGRQVLDFKQMVGIVPDGRADSRE